MNNLNPGPKFTVGQRFDLSVGDAVICHGYRGTVTEVHNGILLGMVDVRLARGGVCTEACFPELYPTE